MKFHIFLSLVLPLLISSSGFTAELKPKRAPAETIFDLPSVKSRNNAIVKKSFKIAVNNYSSTLSNEELLVVVTLKCIHPTSTSSIRQIWGGEPNYSVLECGTEVFNLKLDSSGVATVPNLTFLDSEKINYYSVEVDIVSTKGNSYRFVSHGSTRRYELRNLNAQQIERLDYSIYVSPAVEFKITPPPKESPSTWTNENTVTATIYIESKDGLRIFFDILTNKTISTKEAPKQYLGRYVILDGDLGRNPTTRVSMKYVDGAHFLPNDPYTRCSGVLLQKQIKFSELAETLNASYQAPKTPCQKN